MLITHRCNSVLKLSVKQLFSFCFAQPTLSGVRSLAQCAIGFTQHTGLHDAASLTLSNTFILEEFRQDLQS